MLLLSERLAPQDGWWGGFMSFPFRLGSGLVGGGYTGRSIAEPRNLDCRVIAKVSCCEPVSRSGIIMPKWGGGAAILAPKSPKGSKSAQKPFLGDVF